MTPAIDSALAAIRERHKAKLFACRNTPDFHDTAALLAALDLALEEMERMSQHMSALHYSDEAEKRIEEALDSAGSK